MGCISSKSSNHEQTNHRSKNEASELILPKHDNIMSIDFKNKEHSTNGSRRWSLEENKLTVERFSSFHTVEEYDEMLQRINTSKDHDDGEVVGGPVPVPVPVTAQEANCEQPIIDLAGRRSDLHTLKVSSCNDESGIQENKTEDIEFQTVASLRQWLQSSRDSETRVEDLVTGEIGKKQENETIIELVAAFDQYMQQLHMDEDNILKRIHNIIA